MFMTAHLPCCAYPSGAPEFTPDFSGVCGTRSSLCVMFCRSLFVLLSFLFRPLCCLFFWFTDSYYPLVSSNSSFYLSYRLRVYVFIRSYGGCFSKQFHYPIVIIPLERKIEGQVTSTGQKWSHLYASNYNLAITWSIYFLDYHYPLPVCWRCLYDIFIIEMYSF